MTPLGRRLAKLIATDGPMTLADYMTACLLDPEHGYYATRDPFGAGGDFITAPEISQMFGELVGLALAQAWIDQGAPSPFSLVELGPGRGTLMADILRATTGVPGFHAAAEVVLVEASPTLRDVQKATVTHALEHKDRIEDVAERPLFLVANEFFDALPIRQFQRAAGAWRERLVGLKDDRLTLGLGDQTQPPTLSDRLVDTRPGDIVEVSEPSRRIAAEIGRKLADNGGAAIVIDYGGARSLGDTFQAVRAHDVADPLAAPGEADLTAHVDFGALARAAGPAMAAPLVTQGVWLERLGIAARARALAAKMSGARLDQHMAAHRRLTHPDEMGTLFKVLGLHAPRHPPPPGFDP